MKPFKLLALAAVAVALAPAFAMAASLDVGGTVTVGANAGSGTSVGTDVNVGANAGTNSGSSTGAMQGDARSGSATGSSMAGASGMLMITAQDAAADANAQGAGMVTSSANVANDADFAAYAKSQLRADPNIKEVDSDNSSVAVKYAEHGHFLGVFPVTMTASAKVAADGSITISHPWYYFLTSTSANDAALKASLAQSTVGMFHTTPSAASEGATSTASGQVTLTAAQKAALLATIRAALATSAAMSASGTASTSASY